LARISRNGDHYEFAYGLEPSPFRRIPAGRLHLKPVGSHTRLHLRALARQSAPQLHLVRGAPHPAILQNRPELIVEFCSAAGLLG